MEQLVSLLPKYPIVKALTSYITPSTTPSIPTLVHLSAASAPAPTGVKTYSYSSASPYFPLPTFPAEYNGTDGSVAHSRTLSFFKAPDAIAGPLFDLDAMWEASALVKSALKVSNVWIYYRNIPSTSLKTAVLRKRWEYVVYAHAPPAPCEADLSSQTMVAEPYVNHIPTMWVVSHTLFYPR